MRGPMDEAARLADGILDAYEDIPQLRLKRPTVPDERRRGSILEMEVAATKAYFASRGIEARIIGKPSSRGASSDDGKSG